MASDISESRKIAINARNALSDLSFTRYLPDQCDVKYEPVDCVLRMSDAYIWKRERFFGKGEDAVAINIDGSALDVEEEKDPDPDAPSRVDALDGINVYSDYNLLRAVWYLEYATTKQVIYMCRHLKKTNKQLSIVVPDPETDPESVKAIRQRLNKLSKEGLLWTYKVNLDADNPNAIVRAYSMTAVGCEFIRAVSGIPYKTHIFTSAVPPARLLNRIAENRLLIALLNQKGDTEIEFRKPFLRHDSSWLQTVLGTEVMEMDYKLSIDNDKKSLFMVQAIPDPRYGYQIYTRTEKDELYQSYAELACSFLHKRSPNEEPMILFVCPSFDAFNAIWVALKNVKTKNFLTDFHRQILFTGEGTLPLAVEDFNNAVFGIIRTVKEGTTSMQYSVGEPLRRYF